MICAARLILLVVLLGGVVPATSSVAADLDALMKEFRVTPSGLRPAPRFSLKTLEGKTAALSDHRGRGMLVYFWATW